MKCMCTVFAMLLIFISVIAPTVANEAEWMPDANLRSAVRSALSIADDDALPQQAMRDLTSLTATNSQISNITGLEHATELTHLDIRENAITDATPLSTLTNLELLRLKGNTVSDMSALSGLTNLTVLNLRLTGISSVSTLSGLTKLEHLRVDDNNITDVEPLTSLTNLQRLWVAGNELTNAHLLSSLTNLTRIDIEIPDPPDTTAPDVSISVPSEVQTGAFDVVIRFTEVVSGFLQADVSLGGTATASITDWNITDNTVFTAEITPTTSGEVTFDIDADVATDAANNSNTAATQQTVTVDVDRPTVSISVPSGTQNGAFDATITFSEVVLDFVQTDVSLSGTATASITDWVANTDNTVYTATIMPTTSGNVILNISNDIATDAAGNKNTAATAQKVDVVKDETDPEVSISVLSGVQDGAFDVTITFTEVVLGFEQTDLSISGTATVSITAWSTTDNTVYTATITPTTSGTVILNISNDVATDAAGNKNTAATAQKVDVVKDETDPEVSISVPSGTQNGVFDVTITFTEVVSGFEQADVSLGGTATADITAWDTTDNTVFTATITPTTSGEVTLDIDEDVATDAANNPNTAATQQTVTVDVDVPTVVISAPFETQNGAFDVSITFTEAVSDFEEADVSLGGTAIASITDWNTTDNTVFTAEITPTTSGEVTLDIDEDVATDAANNPNTAASTQTVTVDVDAPTVVISVPSEVQNGAFDVIITFTEAVSGFEEADLSLGGTAIASITDWNTTDNTVFTAEITPTTSGEVTLDIDEDVATDAADNPNTAATSQTVTIAADTVQPDVSISVDLEFLSHPSDRYVTNGPFEMRVTFTEPVSGFEQSDIFFWSNDHGITFTDFTTIDDQTYTVNVIPDPSSDYYRIRCLEIPEGSAIDAAGNPNTSAKVENIYFSKVRSIPQISVPDSVVVTETFTVEVRFDGGLGTQAFGFEQSELLLTNNTAEATITDWSVDSYHSVFTAEITATQSGRVTFGISEGVATNAEGNPNRTAIQKSVEITLPDSTAPEGSDADIVQPDVSISVDLLEFLNLGSRSYATNGPFEMRVTFTEPVSGFEQSDIFFWSDDHGITFTDFTTIDDQTYTVNVIPDSSSYYYRIRYLEIPEGSAIDAAGNPNTSAKVEDIYFSKVRSVPQISVPDSVVVTETFTVEVRFADGVGVKAFGFEQSELLLTNNTAEATITDWSVDSYHSVFTAEITATQSGRVTFGISEGVATNAAGNPNRTAIQKSVEITLPDSTAPEGSDADTVQPDVSISVDLLESLYLGIRSYVTNGPFEMRVTFTEPVSGFEQSDIFFWSDDHGITFTDFTTIDDQAYTVNVIPDPSSDYYRIRYLEIPEGSAIDAAGNPNTSAKVKDIYFSKVRSVPQISVPDSVVVTETFTVEVRFADGVGVKAFGFEQSELLLTNNTAEATITDWSVDSYHSVFTAEITATQSGRVTFGVSEGVATDAAGNPNTAAVLRTVTITLPDPATWMPDANLRAAVRTALNLQTNAAFTQTSMLSLTSLSAANQQIADVTGLEYATNLTELILNGNAISDVNPLANLSNLTTLRLAGNPILDTSALYPLTLNNLTDVDISISLYPAWDVNEDGNVDAADITLVTLALGQSGDGIVNSRTDVNMNGTVDNTDLLLVAGHLDADNGAPLRAGMLTLPDRATLETLDSAILERELDILRAESDGSLKYLRAIALLETILDARRPDETRLLANYPNPFNPETWIPYHLAKSSDVRITIYDVRGTVVRQLDLGHQREGYYTSRSRAAYWDGRNNFGERVASGIYFYQFEADNMSLLRKMLILK